MLIFQCYVKLYCVTKRNEFLLQHYPTTIVLLSLSLLLWQAMIFNTWKDKRGCLSASDGTSLQSFIPEIGICPSWVRCWSMWLLPRRRSPLPIPHPEIEEMVSVKPYIQLPSFINAKISDVCRELKPLHTVESKRLLTNTILNYQHVSKLGGE